AHRDEPAAVPCGRDRRDGAWQLDEVVGAALRIEAMHAVVVDVDPGEPPGVPHRALPEARAGGEDVLDGDRGHRCTRPLSSPAARRRPRATETRVKSPGMVCLSALAAIANASASAGGAPSRSAKISPAAKLSPPPMRSTSFRTNRGPRWSLRDLAS